MNTLLNIIYNGWFCCYCQDSGRCLMCQIPLIFDGFKQRYKEKMFYKEFLNLEHGKLYGYLIKLFKEEKDFIDCFIHCGYTFRWHAWQSREAWSVDKIRGKNSIRSKKKKIN